MKLERTKILKNPISENPFKLGEFEAGHSIQSPDFGEGMVIGFSSDTGNPVIFWYNRQIAGEVDIANSPRGHEPIHRRQDCRFFRDTVEYDSVF